MINFELKLNEMKKIIIISCCIAVLVFNCKKDKKIIANPGYAIGIIDFYKPYNKGPSIISFDYYIGLKKYSNGYQNNDYGWSVPSSGAYTSGDKYMVQYDLNDPNTCRFLFDYPVHDSADYINDVNQFKIHPPSCCFIWAYK